MNVDKLSKYSRPVIAYLLISGGMLQLAAPVLADGTAAGTQITNTATASYEDPTDPNKPLNTFSNTVKVAVAEVAGVTVTADTFAVVKGGTNTGVGAEAGDKVNFDYIVTNVGNDATQFRIPGTATVAGAGSVDKVQYLNDAGVWTDIPNAGEFISPSKNPGESLKVRVITSILPGAGSNTDVVVTLGNTTAPGAQNVTRDATGGDVFTVDNADGANANEVNGAPENGVREAAASQKVTIGATPEAFATVTKVRSAQSPGANPNILTDDTLTYTLALKVAGQADVPSTSNKIAADLTATTINLDSSSAQRVLVSDAVPEYTTAQTLTVPTGWTAVYTNSATSINANAALWTSIVGTGTVTVPNGATRVGFVSSGPIAKGTTTPDMLVTVGLTGIPITGGNVANIAQVFGSTDVNGTPKPVYDESGDNQSNNFNDNGTPGLVDVTGNPVVSTGVVSPTSPGVTDANNNNTGTGEAGEPNVVAIAPPGQAGILNGTSNKPDAIGPNGNNDDFTNVSAPIPATTWILDTVPTSPTFGTYSPSPVNPGAVAFSNTFETAAGSPTSSVNLLPATPSVVVPTGTKVTISYGGTSKVYSFDGTKFVNDGTTDAATPLIVPNVAPGTKVNYGVEVDLPAGTPQLAGYSVPVVAFVDVNGDGLLDPADKQNTTIDRVYTGYLKLTKEAQIADASGGIIEAFTAAPTKRAQPGQSIEYRITYKNISEIAPANSGSVTLNAQNIKVTEDGNAAPNNWAPITTHKVGSATDSNNGAISFDGGASNNSTPAVAVYKDVVAGPLAPQATGTFNFTRVVK